MEKWNSKRAKEFGVDKDLLAAVNVAVKEGRNSITSKTKYSFEGRLYLLRKELKQLQEEGVNLYEVNMYEHHGAYEINFSEVSLIPLQLSNPRETSLNDLNERYQKRLSSIDCRHLIQRTGRTYFLALSSGEIFSAAAKSMEHNYDKEYINGNEWLNEIVLGENEDLRMSGDLQEVIMRARLYLQEGVSELKHLRYQHLHEAAHLVEMSSELYNKTIGEVSGLTREYCPPNSEKWLKATERILKRELEINPISPSSENSIITSNEEKKKLAWNFLSSLFPHLKNDDTAKSLLNSKLT